MKSYLDLLNQTARYAQDYIQGLDLGPVFPGPDSLAGLDRFDEPLPEVGCRADEVIQTLHQTGSQGTTAQTGGRYFGFVCGGLLPAAHAAQWLVDTWNQNSALYLMSPVAAKLEEVCEGWLAQLLGLAPGTAAGYVTGSANALICALAAARHSLLAKQGYDLAEGGLRNAPPVRVVVGEQAHATVWSALSLLGFGRREMELAPTDHLGRIIAAKLPPLGADTIVIAQAGNVNGGAFDPIGLMGEMANQAGSWLHIDGAFGLWAAASKKRRHLVEGLEKADSYSLDGHKTLNASYDCGLVLCKDRQALTGAMRSYGSYLNSGHRREPMMYVTEMSRRPRAVPLWAALKSLGASGVEEMVDRLCDLAEYFARQLAMAGLTVINEVFFNQFMCKAASPEKTESVLAYVQNSGILWCGGSRWCGEPVIRLSVCSHRTTADDIDKCIEVFREALQ